MGSEDERSDELKHKLDELFKKDREKFEKEAAAMSREDLEKFYVGSKMFELRIAPFRGEPYDGSPLAWTRR